MESHRSIGQEPANWLPQAIVAGFVAATAMLVAFLVAYALAALSAAIEPTGSMSGQLMRSWFHAVTVNALVDPREGALYLLVSANLCLGLVGAVVYAAAEPWPAGPSWARGLVVALPLWLVCVTLLLSVAGGGVFGTALGAGPLPFYGTLLAYLAYGSALGVSYRLCSEGLEEALRADDLLARDRALPAGALGALVGLVLGALVGVSLGPVWTRAGQGLLSGLPPGAPVLGLGLVGAGLGQLAGLLGGLAAMPVPTAASVGELPVVTPASVRTTLPLAKPALLQLRVAEVHGVCPRGYRLGDVFSCSLEGTVSPALCPAAAGGLQPLLAEMARGEPDAPRGVACPIYDHMLVLQPAGATA